jgi:FkbM family methyltransferase
VIDDLIIDVGMHTGEDTAFYLAKGFRVVAVEANPSLVRAGERRFAADIADGQLRVVHAAIADRDEPVELFVAVGHYTRSTTTAAYLAGNEARGIRHKRIQVPGVRFEAVLADVGIPYYLKVDIEGSDHLCIDALAAFDECPTHVSRELPNGQPEVGIRAIEALHALGYRRFKLVDPSLQRWERCPLPPLEGRYVPARFDGFCTGPFGEEAPGRWVDVDRAVRGYQQFVTARPSEEERARRLERVRTSPLVHALASAVWRSRSRPLMDRYNRWRGAGWLDVHATR